METTIPLELALRAVAMLQSAGVQLARTGGMLNKDLAKDVTEVAAELRKATQPKHTVYVVSPAGISHAQVTVRNLP